MKKLLALVLAMVMTLGLATVGTNAAATRFGDDASIKYSEAAAVMSAIGVFDGDDSTNFRPNDTLKRSEAAKIVAYLMLTKQTADSLVPSGSRYSDVPSNHWACGYIEYLTSAGVLGGVGDGKFNPDGDIATVDFAKMLLVALGFDAKIENLVLSDYRINTVKLANEIKLFDGNKDVAVTNAITRQEAALYAFNMIKSPIVEYDSTIQINNISGTNSNLYVGNGKAKKIISKNESEQKVSFAPYNGTGDEEYYVEFAERYFEDLENAYASIYSKNGYSVDDLGRPMRKWTWKKAEIGKFVATQDLLERYTAKVGRSTVYELVGKTTYDNIKDGRANLIVHLNGEEIADINALDYVFSGTLNRENLMKYFIERNNSSAFGYLDDDKSPYYKLNDGNGVITEVYQNSDKDVYIAVYYQWVYQVAADYNESRGNVTLVPVGDTAIRLKDRIVKVEDYPQIKDYKTDDYVIVTAAHSSQTDAYEVQSVDKAQILTGEVSTYTTESGGTGVMKDVTIGGEKKSYSKTTEKDGVRSNGFSIGNNATVVLDTTGYIIYVDEAIVVNDYVLVRNWGSNSNLKAKAVADAVFSDGTSAEITVKQAYSYEAGTVGGVTTAVGDVKDKAQINSWGTSSGAGLNLNRWYIYSKNSSNEYTLSHVPTGYKYSGYTYGTTGAAADDGKVVVKGDNVTFMDVTGSTAKATNTLAPSNVMANDKTVMVLRDKNDDLFVYSGVKNLAKVTLKSSVGSTAKANAVGVYAVTNKDNYAVAVYVHVDTNYATVSGAANDKLVLVRDYEKNVKTADKTYYQYRTISIDGTETRVNADSEISDNTNTRTKFYVANYVSVNKDGVLTNFSKVGDSATGTVRGAINANGLSYKDSALVLDTNNGSTINQQSFIVNSDTKILLIKLKKSTGVNINTDEGLDYEPVAMTGSGKQITSELSGYNAQNFDYAARVDGDTSSVLKELYIIIREASYAKSIDAATGDVSAKVSEHLSYDGAQVTVNATGNITLSRNDILVDDGQTLVINAGANNVTIGSDVTVNGTMTINSTGVVKIDGHVDNNGTLTVNGAAFEVNGNSLEILSGGETYVRNGNMEVNGYLNVDFGSLLDVTGNLTFNSRASLDLDGDLYVTGRTDCYASNNNVTVGNRANFSTGTKGTLPTALSNVAGAVVSVTLTGYTVPVAGKTLRTSVKDSYATTVTGAASSTAATVAVNHTGDSVYFVEGDTITVTVTVNGDSLPTDYADYRVLGDDFVTQPNPTLNTGSTTFSAKKTF